jgi:hypothetical protein
LQIITSHPVFLARRVNKGGCDFSGLGFDSSMALRQV